MPYLLLLIRSDRAFGYIRDSLGISINVSSMFICVNAEIFMILIGSKSIVSGVLATGYKGMLLDYVSLLEGEWASLFHIHHKLENSKHDLFNANYSRTVGLRI